MLFGPTALGPKQNKPMAHLVTKNNINKAQVNFSFKAFYIFIFCQN